MRRIAPLNTIDISISDLTKVEVEFFGYEDADLTGSEQYVLGYERLTKTITIGSGFSRLGRFKWHTLWKAGRLNRFGKYIPVLAIMLLLDRLGWCWK